VHPLWWGVYGYSYSSWCEQAYTVKENMTLIWSEDSEFRELKLQIKNYPAFQSSVIWLLFSCWCQPDPFFRSETVISGADRLCRSGKFSRWALADLEKKLKCDELILVVIRGMFMHWSDPLRWFGWVNVNLQTQTTERISEIEIQHKHEPLRTPGEFHTSTHV